VDETRIITTEGLPQLRAWAQDEDRKSLAGDGTFLTNQKCLEGHEEVRITTIWKETKRTQESERLDTDHQRGQYYEHCSRSIVLQELKKKPRCLPLLSFSRRDEEIYSAGGGKKDQR